MNVFNLPFYRGVLGQPSTVMGKQLFLLPMGLILTTAKYRWQATHCCPPPRSLIRTEMPRVQLILFWARTDWTDAKREVYISRLHSSYSHQETVLARPCELHVRASCFVKCSIFIFFSQWVAVNSERSRAASRNEHCAIMFQTSVWWIWSCSLSLCSSVVLTLARGLFPSTDCCFSRVRESCQVPGFSPACTGKREEHWHGGAVRPSCCGWHRNETAGKQLQRTLPAWSWMLLHERINWIKEVLLWREKCKMDTTCRKFSAQNTVLVQTVWSLAGKSVKHEFLSAAVRFYLLAVGCSSGCSGHFAAPSMGCHLWRVQNVFW